MFEINCPGDIRALAASIGTEIHTASAISRTSGWQKLLAIHIGRFNLASKTVSPPTQRYETDCLLVSGGWSPAIHLTSQFGGKPEWSDELQAFLPGEPLQNWHGAGAVAGEFGLANTVNSGINAAKNALQGLRVSNPKN